MRQFSEIAPIEISFGGKQVKARSVSVTSIFEHNAEYFFGQECIRSNTAIIVRPMAKLTFLRENSSSERWEKDFDYELDIRPYGLLKIWGVHHIRVTEIDEEKMEITTVEKNDLCKVWDHRLSFRKTAENRTEYTDEVILYAGRLTGILARSLVSSYKKRHKNWDRLLREKQGI